MKIKLFTVPNMITLGNLLCGCLSIVASLVVGDFKLALIFIIASAVCDFFDGFTARLLRQYSDIGVQLDSLADMVSFGVAPSAMMFAFALDAPTLFELNDVVAHIIVYVPFIMAAFSALRLAKFNIDDSQHETFEGLPTPANALFCASFVYAALYSGKVVEVEWIALISVVMAALLVSPIRMFSFKLKSFGWSKNKSLYIFLALSLVALLTLGVYSVPTIIVLYIVISTIGWLFCKK
ncbi:MAG: CDP-diacylglycerol--serine O-phosphatidyltransferase [Rikenellaceae bacterium]|nr:CDP-diacylglycerol--serine O-phosphatidyltransferase [Rikenellaceae bacterium]